jgi:hypothetical protein
MSLASLVTKSLPTETERELGALYLLPLLIVPVSRLPAWEQGLKDAKIMTCVLENYLEFHPRQSLLKCVKTRQGGPIQCLHPGDHTLSTTCWHFPSAMLFPLVHIVLIG